MSEGPVDAETRAQHWDGMYRRKGAEGVSWHQDEPARSLAMFELAGVSRDDAVIDVGGGASPLVDRLVDNGHTDVTVLDLSRSALDTARARLPADAPVSWLHEDLLAWQPRRRFDVWHDRALFHFLTDPADRARYREALTRALVPRGVVVLATFAEDGPDTCSDLPVARYSAEELAAQLGGGFSVLAAERELHRAPSGAVQPFTWLAARAVTNS